MTRTASGSLGFHAAAVAAIATLCALLYGSVLEAEFVLDDYDNILRNPYIRWNEISLENLARSTFGPAVRRPVAHASFGLNHWWAGGHDVRSYRAVNLVVHTANGVLVYLFALTLLGRLRSLPGRARAAPAAERSGWVALCAALIFVAHPLQIQSVTYIVQRMNSLAVMFYLGCLLLYLRARQSRGRVARGAGYAAAGLCGLLALGSKEIAVTLPFAIWLTEWFFFEDLDRAWLRRRLPLMALLAGAGLVFAALYASSPGYATRDFTAGERLLTQTRVAVFYLSLLFFPAPYRLNLLHEIEPSRSLVAPLSTLGSAMLLLGLVVFACVAARRRRLLAFAILWFFLQLALEGSTPPLRMIFEHRTYLPLVGAALLVPTWIFARLDGRRGLSLAVCAAIVASLAGATWVRNQTWRDVPRLWIDTATKSPGDPLARMQLGSVLARQGRYEEALVEIGASIRLDPSSARPHNLRGAVLLAQGRREEALAEHFAARRLDPADPVARASAARLLAELGRLEEAARMLEEALAIVPDEQYVLELARIRARQGRPREALAQSLRAVEMNARFRQARVEAGILLVQQGRPEAAIEQFAAALDLAADAEVHAHLGNALWASGRAAEAIAQFEHSVRLRPDWLVGVNNLAWMLATCPDSALRDPARAIELARAGLRRLGGEEPDLLDSLAAGYAARGRFDEAAATAARAAQLARASGAAGLARRIDARRALYAAGRPYVSALAPEAGSDPETSGPGPRDAGPG